MILLLVAVSIGWIPLIQQMQGGQMYVYIQSIAAYISPPIAMTFCMAMTWARMNEAVRKSFRAHFGSNRMRVKRLSLLFVFINIVQHPPGLVNTVLVETTVLVEGKPVTTQFYLLIVESLI